MSVNESLPETGVVYWALNDFGVSGYYLVINGCIGVLAGFVIALNCLVLQTLMKLTTKEPTDIFLCGFAVADALTGVFLLYNTSFNLINYQIYLECAFRMGLVQFLFISSIFHMTALTLDRYIKIVHPFHYTTVFNATSVTVICTIFWVVSFMIGLLPVLGWNKRSSSEDVSQDPPCGFFAIFDKAYLTFATILYSFPIILMTGLYLHIFKIANRHARAIEAQDKMVKDVPFKDRHAWKYTKTVLIIVGVYLLCWFPTGIIISLHVDGRLEQHSTEEKGTLIMYASAIAYLNSLANPIIYAFKIPSVRKRFMQVFCSCRSTKNDSLKQRRTDMSETGQSSDARTQVTSLGTSGIEDVTVTD